MAETNTPETSAPEQVSAEKDENVKGAENTTAKEKKYTDDEMNNIVKKNKEKAVSDFCKELGITDREKAKQILAGAKPDDDSKHGDDDDGGEQLTQQLMHERAEKERAIIENVFLSRSADPKKVERAARLIDPSEIRDENGKFDRKKAEEAVDALLKEWPELKKAQVDSKTGFVIGSDGSQGGTDGKTNKQKPPAQKSWNRFN